MRAIAGRSLSRPPEPPHIRLPGAGAGFGDVAAQRAEAVRLRLIGMGVKPGLVIATDHPGSPISDGRLQIILTPIQSR